MANQFLALSMFIMLLSFFIVLNSMSTFEEVKSNPVLNSISIAFANKEVDKDSAPNYEEDKIQDSYREGDTLDQLEKLFRSQITGVDIQKNRLGTVMNIRVSLKKFEKEISTPAIQSQGAALGGMGGSFAPLLISLLQASETKIPYRMDMILNIEENPAKVQNDQPQEMQGKIKKVAGFAEILEGAGLPKKFITSGVGQGEEGTIDLFFRRYEVFNPIGSEAEEGAPG